MKKFFHLVAFALLLSGCSTIGQTLNLGKTQQVGITKIELPLSAKLNEFVNANVTFQTMNASSSAARSITFDYDSAKRVCYLRAFDVMSSTVATLSESATRSQNISLRFDATGSWLVQASQSSGVATASIAISGS